jgi:hypothetical protein
MNDVATQPLSPHDVNSLSLCLCCCCCCCIQVQAATADSTEGAPAALLEVTSPLGNTTANPQEREQEVRIMHCIMQNIMYQDRVRIAHIMLSNYQQH